MKLEFNLKDNLDKIKKSDSYFHTFINKDSLATGILILKPGEEDTQEPHESDEVYFIISGNGFLKIKNKDYEISKDKLFFVGKDVPHYFHSNSKELKVLYFFGGSDS
ncbi:cupin domain-containing protein [Nitrosopumilus sp.]|nr:cupin domain-containing protein [Nitrosopumilus sp.]